MYEGGEGTPQNYDLAAKWYRKAAEHVPDLGGAGQGRNNLGMLYLDGHGVPNDYVQAYMWFSLSGFGESNPNLFIAKAHMTSEQILEAERVLTCLTNGEPGSFGVGFSKSSFASGRLTSSPFLTHILMPPSV